MKPALAILRVSCMYRGVEAIHFLDWADSGLVEGLSCDGGPCVGERDW